MRNGNILFTHPYMWPVRPEPWFRPLSIHIDCYLLLCCLPLRSDTYLPNHRLATNTLLLTSLSRLLHPRILYYIISSGDTISYTCCTYYICTYCRFPYCVLYTYINLDTSYLLPSCLHYRLHSHLHSALPCLHSRPCSCLYFYCTPACTLRAPSYTPACTPACTLYPGLHSHLHAQQQSWLPS